MAFLGKGRKCDLIALAHEMRVVLPPDSRVFEIKDLIAKSPNYDENFVRDYFQTILDEREQERIAREKLEIEAARFAHEEKEREDNNKFELEKLKLQIEAQKLLQPAQANPVNLPMNIQLKRLVPDFNPHQDDFALFINLFERQLKFLKIEKEHWVSYLLGVLPNEIAQLIAREPEEQAQNFDYIRTMLLRRFKLSAEKFRNLFATQRKSSDKTWKDFHFELRRYFEGWLAEMKIHEFENLKDLMILDQLKKRVSPEIKEHFLDVWCEWVTPEDLVNKLDTYDNLRINRYEVKPSHVTSYRKYYPIQKEQKSYYQKKSS